MTVYQKIHGKVDWVCEIGILRMVIGEHWGQWTFVFNNVNVSIHFDNSMRSVQ